MNLLLHALAALALFGLVRRTLRSGRLRPRYGDAATTLALTVALVWLVHPLLTDAVTYITQRTELLLGLFYFSTLYCAMRAGEPDASAPRRRWFAAAAVTACALGMGSKQTMVVVPVMVWLWDWMLSDEGSSASPLSVVRARWPLYAGLAATWLILAALVAYERWPHSIGFDREGWTPWTYLLTQTVVIAHYAKLAFWPDPLVLDYAGWPMSRSLTDVLPYALPLAALVAATCVAVIRRRPWGLVGAWCFVALAPSSSVLPLATEIAAERRMYVPLAGVVAAVVIGGYQAGRWILARWPVPAPARRRAGAAAALLIVGSVVFALSAETRERNRAFWSEEAIWRDTVDKRPTNPRARLNYGVELSLLGRYADAERQLQEAVRLKETSSQAQANLGSVLCYLGRLEEGVAHLERAIALDPETREAYPNLGEAYGALGKRALAAKNFALAVDAAPDNVFLLNRLAWLLATSPEDEVRQGAKAVDVAERAVRLTSRLDADSLDSLAAAYAEAGRFDAAVAAARDAIAIADRLGNADAVRTMRARLALYEERQPFREGVGR